MFPLNTVSSRDLQSHFSTRHDQVENKICYLSEWVAKKNPTTGQKRDTIEHTAGFLKVQANLFGLMCNCFVKTKKIIKKVTPKVTFCDQKISWTYQYQKNRVYPTRYLCCFQPYFCLFAVETDWHSISTYCLCLLLPVALFLLSGFPVSMPPLFPAPSLSPSRIPPLTLSFRSSLEACGSGTKLWWRVLFVGAGKNDAVTFPAFQLAMSCRRSLSNEDRDPGGGGTGCSSNHFRSHHFLQVDWTNVKNPFRFAHALSKLFCSSQKNHHLCLSATFIIGADEWFSLIDDTFLIIDVGRENAFPYSLWIEWVQQISSVSVIQVSLSAVCARSAVAAAFLSRFSLLTIQCKHWLDKLHSRPSNTISYRRLSFSLMFHSLTWLDFAQLSIRPR